MLELNTLTVEDSALLDKPAVAPEGHTLNCELPMATRHCQTAAWAIILLGALTHTAFAQGNSLGASLADGGKSVQVEVDEQPAARFVTRHDEILRPFLCDLCGPGGVQVTRRHPPDESRDLTDHATMHPGIWLAFGDFSGVDFWRNRGRVETTLEGFASRNGLVAIEIRGMHEYYDDERTVAFEDVRLYFVVRPDGHLIVWDSTFEPGKDPLVFGDQEEMGLGVRVATPLTVERGGTVINSAGQRNEEEAWGQVADWCAYYGKLDGGLAGLVLMPHPENFRRSWFHVRDYGLMLANPFGRRAFTGGEPSAVTVTRDKPLRLRFGVFAFDKHEMLPDFAAIYADYQQVAAQLDEEADE